MVSREPAPLDVSLRCAGCNARLVPAGPFDADLHPRYLVEPGDTITQAFCRLCAQARSLGVPSRGA